MNSFSAGTQSLGLRELWGSAAGGGPIALRRGVLSYIGWDPAAAAVTFGVRAGRALLAAAPAPAGYVFAFTVANGGAAQPAPRLAVAAAAGPYAGGRPLPLEAPAGGPGAVAAPLRIRLWTAARLAQAMEGGWGGGFPGLNLARDGVTGADALPRDGRGGELI